MSKTKKPRIGVIIPTYNRFPELKKCLNSLKKQSYPQKKITLVVIDNNSQDHTATLREQNSPCLKIVHLKKNIGFAPAINLAAKKLKSKYLLVTNDDVIFAKDYLKKLVALMEKNSKVAITHGKMYFRNSKKIATPGFRILSFLGYHPHYYLNLNLTQECDIATGGNMFIRRLVYDKVGGFDPGFFFCGEDYDFCFRVKKIGYQIFYHPQAVCSHGFLASRKKAGFTQKALFSHYQGKFRYMLKNASLWQFVFFFPAQFIGWPIVAFFRGGASFSLYPPMLKAVYWNLNHLKETLKARKKTLRMIKKIRK